MDAPSKYGHLRKENFLSDRPVFVNQAYSDTLFKPETAFPHMHIHDFVELSMVISGEGYHRTLNDLTACAPGDVYVINTGAPHAYFIKEKGDTLVVRNLIFDPSDILDAELSAPESPRYCCGLFREDPMISHIFLNPGFQEEVGRIMDRIEKEQVRKELEWETSVKAHLLDILIMCSRRIVEKIETANDKTVPKLRNRQIALTVMCEVLERYSDPAMTLESIAETVFLSKSHLSYVFKQVTGLSFSEYVASVRLEEARRLLRETNMTNEQICCACGFRDVPSFYRFFRTHVGMTPFVYRKESVNAP